MYTGPPPKLAIAPSATTQHMVASKATDQWPTHMAEWLAQLALATCSAAASTAVPDRGPATQLATDIDDEPNEDLGYKVNEPEGPLLLGGTGPPKKCFQNDGIKDFHDGGGLCSEGRWPRHRRGYAGGASWDWLRAQILDIVEWAPYFLRRAEEGLFCRDTRRATQNSPRLRRADILEAG